jgi:hypothetical protein
MSTEDLEKRVEEAEREAMEAVDGFLNSGKNPPVPVPASPAIEWARSKGLDLGHEWDERTRKCLRCGLKEADFRMSPNPMACIIVMDSHGNRCPKCPNFAF